MSKTETNTQIDGEIEACMGPSLSQEPCNTYSIQVWTFLIEMMPVRHCL